MISQNNQTLADSIFIFKQIHSTTALTDTLKAEFDEFINGDYSGGVVKIGTAFMQFETLEKVPTYVYYRLKFEDANFIREGYYDVSKHTLTVSAVKDNSLEPIYAIVELTAEDVRNQTYVEVPSFEGFSEYIRWNNNSNYPEVLLKTGSLEESGDDYKEGITLMYAGSNRFGLRNTYVYTGTYSHNSEPIPVVLVINIKKDPYTIVTETEYQALGDVVNTDGVLYFITED